MNSDKAELEANVIDAIYRGASDSAELLRAAELIAQYVKSPGVSVGELDRAQSHRAFAFGANTIDRAVFAGYGQYATLDSAPRAFAAPAAGKAANSNRICLEAERRISAFVNEFLVPTGLHGSIESPLLSNAARSAMIGIFQDAQRRTFDADEIARLERLVPHLTRTLQFRRLFLQSEARRTVFESIVERHATAMIGLRGDGPPVFVNAAARALAAARDGIELDCNERLIVTECEAATRLAALQAGVARGGTGGLVRIPRPSGQRPYIALVSPLPSGDDLAPNSQAGVLFAIHDPARPAAPVEARLAHLLHIPLRAAKVVQAILEGISLKDYAGSANISINTVRFHLKTAFARTKTRNQADLVRIALSALNDLGPYFADGK